MASRRVAASTVNWVELAKRCTAEELQNFNKLKAITDSYQRRVHELPAELPKIDWSNYKRTISLPGLVDNFQKQYEGMKIAYPPDNVSSKIDADEKEQSQVIAKFKQQCEADIKNNEDKLAWWASLIPYEEMTMEDFYDAHPDLALDMINDPFIYPGDESNQPWYDNSDVPEEERRAYIPMN